MVRAATLLCHAFAIKVLSLSVVLSKIMETLFLSNDRQQVHIIFSKGLVILATHLAQALETLNEVDGCAQNKDIVAFN